MRIRLAAIIVFVSVIATSIVIAFLRVPPKTPRSFNGKNPISPNQATIKTTDALWEKLSSGRLGFSVQLPRPIEHTQKTVSTPYGDAPLEMFAGSIGNVRFTIAVTDYIPLVAIEFSEFDRFESSAAETPRLLGGNLIRDEPITRNGITGRDQVIEVPGKAIMHSHLFLLGNRSYQAQVVALNRKDMHPAIEEFFLNSFVIDSKPGRNRASGKASYCGQPRTSMGWLFIA